MKKSSDPIEKRLSLVEQAVVSLPNRGGRGVLVGGSLVVTAAHCVDYECDASMTMGRCYPAEIETRHGKILVQPWAVEPVSDIAVLGSLDPQGCVEDAERFEELCEALPAVRLRTTDLPLREDCPIYVFVGPGRWASGLAIQFSEGAHGFAVKMGGAIKSGMSGGPIVDEAGDLLGVVSHSFIFEGEVSGSNSSAACCEGTAPRPHRALPVWVVDRILGRDSTLKT